MKRVLKWIVPLLAVLLIGGLVMRTLHARKQQQMVAAASSKTAVSLELGAADVVTVRSLELTRTLDVSGGLKAVNSAVVKARVGGELKSLTVREGDRVTAGQVIGQIDTADQQLRQQQADQTAVSAKAQLDIAKRALENNRALVDQGFISATGLQTSVSNEAAAQASYGAARAAADLARKTVADARLVAPIAGLVSQRLAQPGERVVADARIVEIVDLSRIELEAAMTPEDVVSIAVGQTARMSVDGMADPLSAKVARINPSTQAGTRAVMVYLALDAHPGLRQGLFAKGRIELQRTRALAVPESAVRIDQAQPYVLQVLDGKVVQRTVALGRRGEAALDTPNAAREAVVEVTGGVAEGATLLRGSVGQVREGTPVRLGTSPIAAVATSLPASSSAR
jgi:RND family efflux transporter MFP subunit